jgi:hypothetical protein
MEASACVVCSMYDCDGHAATDEEVHAFSIHARHCADESVFYYTLTGYFNSVIFNL